MIEELSTDILQESELPEPYVSENALKVLKNRYLKKNEEGETVETPKQMYMRVAQAAASVEEKDQKLWAERFYTIMASNTMMPNSPTLMNAGNTKGKQMCSACFVLEVDDTMESIMQTMKDTAMTQKLGGGTGFSFSKLRPSGSFISGSGGTTSGPLSFIDAYSATTTAIQQGAYRRGANMGILRVDHPDIIGFILAKSDLKRWQNYNVSVSVTEAFMSMLKEKPESHHLVYHDKWGTGGLWVDTEHDEIIAVRNTDVTRELKISHRKWTIQDTWDLICERAWTTGEPGLLFIDEVNKENPVVASLGKIEATNPCGEEPMHSGDSCTLGAINLGKFYRPGFEGPIQDFDTDQFALAIETTTRFLDNILAINDYPIEQMKKISELTRRIGVGIMGFADLLYKMKVPYNSTERVSIATKLSKFLEEETLITSQMLADEKGAFGLFDSTDIVKPQRNAFLRTIAPTGTISIIADCSGGCEPMFALAITRKVMKDSNGTPLVMTEFNEEFKNALYDLEIEESQKIAIVRYVEVHGKLQGYEYEGKFEGNFEAFKDIFITSQEISFFDHIDMQAGWQTHIDAGISKTINLDRAATIEDVAAAYKHAYDKKCKGVTVYRDGCRDNVEGMTQPMNVGKETKEVEEKPVIFDPEFAAAYRMRVNTQWGNIHLKVVVDDEGKEMEIFAQLGKGGGVAPADIEGLCRIASLYLRSGGTIQEVIKQWEDIETSQLVMPGPHGRISSIPDALAVGLKIYLDKVDKMNEKKKNKSEQFETAYGVKCPQCSVNNLTFMEGCKKCLGCGYSAC